MVVSRCLFRLYFRNFSLIGIVATDKGVISVGVTGRSRFCSGNGGGDEFGVSGFLVGTFFAKKFIWTQTPLLYILFIAQAAVRLRLGWLLDIYVYYFLIFIITHFIYAAGRAYRSHFEKIHCCLKNKVNPFVIV